MKKILILCLTACIVMSFMSGCTALKQAVEQRAAEERERMRGTYDGDVYTSEFADLTFTAPDGWEYQNDEEISEAIGVGLEHSDTEMSQETIEKESLYDMLVVNTNTGSNIIIMYAKINGGITEDKFISGFIKSTEEEQALECDFSDITEINIAADSYKTAYNDLSSYGLTQHLYIRKIGRHMMNIIISVFEGDNIEDILDHFSPAETEAE